VFFTFTVIALVRLLWPYSATSIKNDDDDNNNSSSYCSSNTEIHSNKPLSKRWRLLWTAATLVIAFSPELVSLWNHHDSISLSNVPSGIMQLSRIAVGGADPDTLSASSPSTSSLWQLKLQVVGIKCEACASRIKVAVLGVTGITGCQVDLRSGLVLVSLHATDADAAASQQDLLIDAIDALGENYKVTVRGLNKGRLLFTERSW
jgi:copper chaperone CopZ